MGAVPAITARCAMAPALVSREAAPLQPPLFPSWGMTRSADNGTLKIRPLAAALYGARTCLQAMDLLMRAGDSTIGKQGQHNIDNGAAPLCTPRGVVRRDGFQTRQPPCHSRAGGNPVAAQPKYGETGRWQTLFLDTRSAHSLDYSLVK